jgi:predicted DNA-binding transcriptional regulator YafY
MGGAGLPMGEKKDRLARLLRVEHLLYQNPRGLTPNEIAHLCGVCVRTSYRDLRALQDELKVPLWQDHRRYGIAPGYYLPPIKLSLLEAMALFLSARLASRYADESDPNIEGAFTKLASVLPPPISLHVQETIATMAERRRNRDFERIFDILTTAWASRRRVRIWYRWTKPDGSAQKCYDRLLDPYFIEPSGIGHSCYVIGHDHYSQAVRTFKIERIQQIELTNEEYIIPPNWSAREYLRTSWGIFHEEEVEVQIRFSPAVAARVKEAVWHPSQQLEDKADGSLLFTVRVAGMLEITPWILSWGAEAEVIAPPALRMQIGEIAQRLAAAYDAAGREANLAPT